MKGWWINEKVITELQGACRPCQSCKHMAFSYQETIAASIEDNNKYLVAFFDVAKAFDTMWMEGLFKQMYIYLLSKERHCSPGKVGFYPPLIAKETKPTALRALVCI